MKSVTTFDNFPTFAENGSRNMNTESAKYQVGFVEADTFPAEWANYLFHGATKGISDLNTAVQSIWQENINVITQSGQTPSANNNTQLKTAIELMIQNAVLTANAQVLAQAKLDAHPVGSLYWSSDSTDPSILFGGTWVQIKDKFIWAKGDSDTVNAIGGAKTVQLTESQLPSHKHSFSGTTGNESQGHTHSFSWSGSHSHPFAKGGNALCINVTTGTDTTDGFSSGGLWGGRAKAVAGISSTSISVSGTTGGISANHTHSFSGNTDSTGSNNPHENMPPYIVKYCWERTA